MFQNRTLGIGVLLTCSAVTLIAFQNCGTSMRSLSSSSLKLAPAVKVDTSISQSVAALDLISDGMSADQLSQYQVFSSTIFDFDSSPALQLNVFSKTSLTKLEDISQLSDAQKAESYVVITGLNNQRPMIALKEKGADLLNKIKVAIEILSSSKVTAATAQISSQDLKLLNMGASQLYLQRGARAVDIMDGREVSSAEVSELTERTKKLKSAPQIQQQFAEVSQQWQKALEVQNGKAQDGVDSSGNDHSISLASFKKHVAQNSLDLKSFAGAVAQDQLVEVLQFNKSEFKPQDESEVRKCVWFVCWTNGYDGKMAAQYYNQMSGGFAQDAWYYGLNAFSTGLTRCGLPANVGNPNSMTFTKQDGSSVSMDIFPTGCGPSSASSLMDFHWRHFGRNYFGKNFNGDALRYSAYKAIDYRGTSDDVKPGSIWENLFKTEGATGDVYLSYTYDSRVPNTSVGYKWETGKNVVSKAMNSCWYRSGTFTFPADYVSGLNSLLSQAGSEQRVVSAYNYLGGNVIPFINNTNNLADLLRQSVGRNIPAVALYNYGGGSLHYSTVLEYQIRYSVGRTNVMIRPTDQPDRWINLTDPLQIASGVFYLPR